MGFLSGVTLGDVIDNASAKEYALAATDNSAPHADEEELRKAAASQ